jgi:transcriptional regulator with XRE-family HTH domain
MAANNYSERISELMRIKGISKSDLGDAMGVKKQNVNLLLETNNVEKLIGIAKVLGVSLNDIVGEYETEPEVKGCIVYKGVVHPINTKQDIEQILKEIQ